MECEFVKVEGAVNLAQNKYSGAFYKWPEAGRQFRLFILENGELVTLTTSKVTKVIEQNKNAAEFVCADGRFLLRRTGPDDGILVGVAS